MDHSQQPQSPFIKIGEELGKAFLELFYPLHCVGCSSALLGTSRFCPDCWEKLERLTPHHCSICSYPLGHASIFADCCENCSDRELHFVAGVSAFRHQGLVRRLLYQLKYGGDQSLKKALGELTLIALQDKRLQDVTFTAVVPVPLHPRRAREREFNQARLLAEDVAMHLQSPLQELLRRSKPTATQVHSDRKERIKNLKNAFALKKQCTLSGNYLLVDDVLTTGSTLDACAKVLREAGADGIWAVTVARS